jgi:hypothetical protein
VSEELTGMVPEQPTPEEPGAAIPPPGDGAAAEGAAAAAVLPAAETKPAVPLLPTTPAPKTYRYRFVLAYTLLGAALAAALAGLIVLVIRPGHHAPPPWSTWQPKSGSTANVTKDISDRIAHSYKLNHKTQLLAVIPSKPKVTSGTNDVAINYIAVRKAPQSNTGILVLNADKSEQYQLCGLGNNCSIDGGQATQTRGRLVRRQALELALYTFKFAPAVDSVVAFMPPPPGQNPSSVIFLQKSDLKDALSQPISKTLPLKKPPLPTDPDAAEAATIDKLTLPHVYTFELTALQGGGAALVLDPAT